MAAGMERSVLNGSKRTVVSLHRLNKRNMLHFPCGAVAVLWLAVVMEHERTYLLACTSGKTTAQPPVFICRSKQVQTSWI